MQVSFILVFKPEEHVDYVCDLVCVTEREKFLLPIKAIGARGNSNYSILKYDALRNIGYS